MINRLVLNRFRAFREADFQLAPLTIIAGQNSSGKSSIIQSINAILQSTQGRSFPFDLVLNGERAQLGGIRNVIHGHDARNSFGIGVDFSDDAGLYSFYSIFKSSEEEGHLFPRQITAKVDSFGEFNIEWNQKSQSFNVRINPSVEFVDRQRDAFVSGFEKILTSVDDTRRTKLLETLGNVGPSQASNALKELYGAAAQECQDGISYSVQNFSSLLSHASTIPLFDPIRRRISEVLVKLRSRCSYIGPVRASPSRYFPLAGGDLSVDASGEGMSRTLAKWKDRRSSLISEVKGALAQLELASDITVSVEHDEFLKVAIKPHGRAFTDSLADVGFGLSQVLPMIVADLNLPNSGTLMVNQPEIHLHPSSQALLANYFCDRLSKRQYIVETHSEYLINRVRLLVARGKISSDDVRIIYCGADEKIGSKVYQVRVESDGSLTNAPRDFFATYAADAFGIAMAVMDDEEEASDGAE